MLTILHVAMNKQKLYIILLEANILQQRPIPHTVVLILFVSNYSCGVVDHIVVNVQLVEQEVDVEQYAEPERDPALD